MLHGNGARIAFVLFALGLNAGPNLTEWGTVVDTIPGVGSYTDYVFALRQWAADGWPLVPGTYQIRVWYNMREGQAATLTLVP